MCWGQLLTSGDFRFPGDDLPFLQYMKLPVSPAPDSSIRGEQGGAILFLTGCMFRVEKKVFHAGSGICGMVLVE